MTFTASAFLCQLSWPIMIVLNMLSHVFYGLVSTSLFTAAASQVIIPPAPSSDKEDSQNENLILGFLLCFLLFSAVLVFIPIIIHLACWCNRRPHTTPLSPVTPRNIVSGTQLSVGPGQTSMQSDFPNYDTGSELPRSQDPDIHQTPVADELGSSISDFQASLSGFARSMHSIEEIIPGGERTSNDQISKKNTSTEARTCSICLEQLTGPQRHSTFPCSHMFHESCSIAWLAKSSTCPVCRRSIRGSRGG